MGDSNPFDHHSTYNDNQQYNLDRDADPSLSNFSSDPYSPSTFQDSSQIPVHPLYWSSPNTAFPTDDRFNRLPGFSEEVDPVHPISERQYYPPQGNWTRSSPPSTQDVGTNPSVVNRWPSIPQTGRYPYQPYGFYTNSLVADQPSDYTSGPSSSISFQDQSYYLGRMQDSSSASGPVSQYVSPNAYDAPYMFASNQEASSSSLQPAFSKSWNIPDSEPEAERSTSPSESSSQFSTPGGSSVEYSGLPGPYMGSLGLGKQTACQHCRRRKIKCERVAGNDRCQQCIRRDLPECISDESKRGKWIRKKNKKDKTVA